MAYIHAITAGDLEWALYTLSLLVSVLPDELLLMFVLLFTTVLGPIVLMALIAFIAYRFFTGRRR